MQTTTHTTQTTITEQGPRTGPIRLPKALRKLRREEKAQRTASTPPPKPKEKRTPHAVLQAWTPTVELAGSHKDVPAVRVSLFGKHGNGHSMLIDAADWEAMRSLYGTRFFLKAVKGGEYLYVSAHTKNAKAAAGQPGGWGGSLARLIVGAQAGEVVRYRDGNPMNLRRSNLVLLKKKEAVIFKKKHIS